MPRSKDPRNYPQFMHDLVDLMDRGIDKVEFKLGLKEAKRLQHQFYAFIHALAAESERVMRSKALRDEVKKDRARDWARKEDAARRYIVFIEQSGATQHTLTFMPRDLDPRYAGIAAQLQAIEAQLPTFDVPDPTKPVPVDGKTIIEEWEHMAHAEPTPIEQYPVDEDMTDERARDILSSDPPDHTPDLTDLITEDNQGSSHSVPSIEPHAEPANPFGEIFKLAEKDREREREASKKSENKT